ncbi:MAG: response regulator [Candidatus Hodarchaeales archaeon]|jgi:signal transduction histidine kinase
MMSKTQVLVVEDEFLVAEGIKHTLRKLGYDTMDTVAYGEEAVDKVAKYQPDLILMDIKLKGNIDGIEAAKMIQNRHNIPIVFITAYTDVKTINRVKRIKPIGYVVKPFDERELYSTIEIALYNHKLENETRDLKALVKEKAEQLIDKEHKMLQQERSALIGRLAGSIGHDINNPLQYIRGTAELINKLLQEDKTSPSDLKSLAETIMSGCDRISETCNRLGRVSRSNTVKEFNLYDAIESAITMTRGRWKKACEGINRDFTLDNPVIKGIESDVASVFMNLIVNSTQAIDGKNGQINVRVYQSNDNRYIISEVEDNGSGIPQAVLEKIGKESITTKPVEEGIGLGLLSSYNIVLQHGGKIVIDTTLGKRTKFSVILPDYRGN